MNRFCLAAEIVRLDSLVIGAKSAILLPECLLNNSILLATVSLQLTMCNWIVNCVCGPNMYDDAAVSHCAEYYMQKFVAICVEGRRRV